MPQRRTLLARRIQIFVASLRDALRNHEPADGHRLSERGGKEEEREGKEEEREGKEEEREGKEEEEFLRIFRNAVEGVRTPAVKREGRMSAYTHTHTHTHTHTRDYQESLGFRV